MALPSWTVLTSLPQHTPADISGLREQPTNPQPHGRPKILGLFQLSNRISMPLRAGRCALLRVQTGCGNWVARTLKGYMPMDRGEASSGSSQRTAGLKPPLTPLSRGGQPQANPAASRGH